MVQKKCENVDIEELKTHISLIQFVSIYLGGFIIWITEFRGVKKVWNYNKMV